ncbi:type II secretion system F family protein [Methylobacterium brachythecii]|uniref:Pilus assembly protein n=1 Tax=Methylobacterium brachythecii TaxID=1176177 RepID=A0A7W6AMD2_9HYPH|nr:type II secretion system F family protein [Methylobacterium brachythecii]MBB3903869.1 tight adherence protein B [Methylobacterium brachythecii]GLS42618.1 pilus assembly protein [Methylobacterium brachythecii]
MNAAGASIAAGLAAVAAGGVAYVFLMPLLSGERRAEQRVKALGAPKAAVDRTTAINRREQVARSLKEIEAKKANTKITLETRLARAGLDWSRKKFFVVSAIMGLVVGFGVLIVSGNLLAGLGAVFAGGFGLPRWMLSFLQKRRIGKFVLELPNAIDVVVRGIRSGIPVGDCLRIIAREAQEPVRSEFRIAIEAQALGVPMSDAILKMYERVPVNDVNFFAVVIGIQAKSGGNLSEALGNLSRVLRERKKMVGRVQAMSMEAKASAAIIACLPFLVALLTYFSSPDYISLLWTTNIGQLSLLGSGIWMSIGVLAMKKMINFDI